MEQKRCGGGLRGHSGDGMPELSQLVIYHFGDALESALRAAYGELFGGPPPAKFIITLASPDDPPRER